MAAEPSAKTGIERLSREFVINWQGNDFVKYEGLLWAAHEDGLCRVATTLIQVPGQDNGNTAIVHAEVETKKGTFSGIGDASPNNVGRMIVPHIIRMAETRAKARAMRDAVNIGTTAFEELGEDDKQSVGKPAPSAPRSPDEAQPNEPIPFAKASPHKPANANQLATIAKLSRTIGSPEEPREDMTSAEASDRITELSRQYNERKGEPSRPAAQQHQSQPGKGTGLQKQPMTPFRTQFLKGWNAIASNRARTEQLTEWLKATYGITALQYLTDAQLLAASAKFGIVEAGDSADVTEVEL